MRQKSALEKANKLHSESIGGQLALDIDVYSNSTDSSAPEHYIKAKQAPKTQLDTIHACRTATSHIFYREGKPKTSDCFM